MKVLFNGNRLERYTTRGLLKTLIAIELMNGEKGFNELQENIRNDFELNVSPSALYNALDDLKKEGFVVDRSEGRRHYIRIADSGRKWLERSIATMRFIVSFYEQKLRVQQQ